jgi:hypothetical protein
MEGSKALVTAKVLGGSLGKRLGGELGASVRNGELVSNVKLELLDVVANGTGIFAGSIH